MNTENTEIETNSIEKIKTIFEKLTKINVNEHTEIKKTGSTQLTYLSWAWAWDTIKKECPGVKYEILKFENNLPYVYDENTGYMVFTKMTIDDITHEMWLPVMDGANKAMKNKTYEYETKYGIKKVEPATMFDINKTIMRCLVKNIAMFGLGLYIYAGEDLPEGEEKHSEPAPAKTEPLINEDQKKALEGYGYTVSSLNAILSSYNRPTIKSIDECTRKLASFVIQQAVVEEQKELQNK